MARDDAPESDSSEADGGGRAERLQKVLAAAGVGSRRDCETLITEGRVTVDGKVVTELGTKVDPSTCDIAVDGEALRKPRRIYFAVNKPVGVVTTNLDPSGRTRVIDLVPTEERVFAVGRLDRASEGLIIVTNDGALADRVTHPRYGLEKTYQVRIAGSISDEDVQKLRHGIHLSDGFAKVVSLRIRGSHKQSTDLEIVLNEGKNREIRRILARVGHKVLTLRRTAVGPLKLAEMQPGECRKLSNGEVKELLDATQERKKKVRPERPTKPMAKSGRPPRDDEQGMPRPRPERPERTGRPPAGKPVGGKRPKSPYADSQAAMGGRPPKAAPQNKPPAPPAGDEPLKLEDFLPPSIEPTAGQTRGGVIRYDENEPGAGQQQGARTYGGGRGGKPGGRKFGNKPGGARAGGRPSGGRPGGFGKGPPRGKRPAFGAPPEGLEGGDVPLRGARKPGGFRNKRMGSGRPPMGGAGGPGGEGPPRGARGGARPGGFGGRRSGGPGTGGPGGATGGGPRGRKPGGGPRGGRPGGGRPGGPGGGRPGGRPGGGRPGGRPGGGGPRGRRP